MDTQKAIQAVIVLKESDLNEIARLHNIAESDLENLKQKWSTLTEEIETLEYAIKILKKGTKTTDKT